MELIKWVWVSIATLFSCYIFAFKFVRNLNEWYYDFKLRNKIKELPLPPGDMGWPFIGKLLTFFTAFSYGRPDSFINNFVLRYGKTGIYKSHMFGCPAIIVCSAEICNRVLKDDVNFKIGYPKSTLELVQSKRLNSIEGHKRFRRLISSPMAGYNALAMYLERIDNIVTHSLDELSSMNHPVEFLKEMKKISFKIIIQIFLGPDNLELVTKIGDLFNIMSDALFSLPVKAPGFVFDKALKARKTLTKIVESAIEERRVMRKNGDLRENRDFLDSLLEASDTMDQPLENLDIVDLLIMLLFAGHETAATSMMWAIIYLTKHPEYMKKAKEEQEDILKARPSSQKHLTVAELKQMVYLNKVINEMFRCSGIGFANFREATNDLSINGYLIPKGWKVLVWIRTLHSSPEYHSNPDEFNPSRMDDYSPSAGTFLPFGAGSWLCPGKDLARFETSIYLHHFILNYKLERVNPECPITFLPVPRPVDGCLAKVIKLSNEDLK